MLGNFDEWAQKKNSCNRLVQHAILNLQQWKPEWPRPLRTPSRTTRTRPSATSSAPVPVRRHPESSTHWPPPPWPIRSATSSAERRTKRPNVQKVKTRETSPNLKWNLQKKTTLDRDRYPSSKAFELEKQAILGKPKYVSNLVNPNLSSFMQLYGRLCVRSSFIGFSWKFLVRAAFELIFYRLSLRFH